MMSTDSPPALPPTPKVSIGLPVYNGEQYLEASLDSILAQTFTNFELIICDNASTDGTQAICRRYAARDGRIRYHRNAHNIGVGNNHNLTIALAHGEYFRYAADDDLCAPDLLEKCVAVLDAQPDVVLCYTQTVAIDAQGKELYTAVLNRATTGDVVRRFGDVAMRADYLEYSYGLIRMEALRNTRGEQNYTCSDRVLMCELALQGRFYEIPELLFFKRHHPKNEYKDWRARMVWYNPGTEGKIVFPNWQEFFNYFVAIDRARLSVRTKLRCQLVMGKWLLVHGKGLVKDVLVALYQLPQPRSRRFKASSYNWE